MLLNKVCLFPFYSDFPDYHDTLRFKIVYNFVELIKDLCFPLPINIVITLFYQRICKEFDKSKQESIRDKG